jgi:hypothetical protein
VLRRHQPQPWIRCEGRLVEHRERNQRVVLGLHQQRGDANAIQITGRRLRRIVIIGSAEAERWSRENVVKIVD